MDEVEDEGFDQEKILQAMAENPDDWVDVTNGPGKIKIGVSAKTDDAAANIRKIDAATDGLGDSIDHVAKASKAAADNLARMEGVAQRLRHVQELLGREFGKKVDSGDAALFLHNFERFRTGRTIGNQKVRPFDNFENWYAGHSTMFRRQADAERHRRFILASGMQGTSYSRQYGVPAFSGAPGGGGEPEGGGAAPQANFAGGVQRAKSYAMSFGTGMLALAGINSIMSMAGQAVDLATEQATTVDTLKRRMGDVGVSFDDLKRQTADAARALGITNVESSRLAEQFARTAGRIGGNGVGGDLRTSEGFARSFGLDPAEATQFFGTMRRLGAPGGNDQDSRKFALMIATAIEKGGYTAKADEVLSAVADFSTQAARISLTTPNVAGFAGALTSLMSTGRAGLDPAGAAAILGSADASVRHGGGMGAAGLNFSFAALRNRTPGLNNPFQAEGLYEAGLFGTSRQVFGQGAPLAGLGGGIAVDDVTNLDKLKTQLRRQYGSNRGLYLEAMKNYFGLNSLAQAAALDSPNIADLTGAQNLVGAAHMNFSDLSATGIQGIASVAAAKDSAGLAGIFQSIMGRSDVSQADKDALGKQFRGGSFQDQQIALTKFFGTHDQEQTQGTEIRLAISDLKDALTGVGAMLLVPIVAIKEAVVAMAHAAGVVIGDNSSTTPPGTPAPWGGGKGGPGRTMLGQSFGPGGGASFLNDEQLRAIDAAAGGNANKAALMRALVSTENRGFGRVNNTALSPKGAFGAFQFMPGTWADFGDGGLANAANFGASASAASKFIDWIEAKYNTTDPDVVAAYYNGGDPAARAVLAGKRAPTKETQGYLTAFDGYMGSTPIPDGGASRGGPERINIGLSGEVHLPVRDQGGNQHGIAVVRPYVSGQPSGVTGTW